ncbi:DNA-directed RNA polymerase subunit epsilon [Bacillus tianshenii]|nr:DNA-directed RNA polymerase subunit epsilon [Bacillus tianshenii]
MIYKVFYQDYQLEAPVRERTKSLYVEAESERKVREKLKGRDINIEFIQSISGAHLEYEQQSEDFKVENL